MKSGDPVKGRFWNMLEAGCVLCARRNCSAFDRNKDTNRFLPLLWTVFFFVLAMNLIGMVPGWDAATGSISITASIGACRFSRRSVYRHEEDGGRGIWKAQAPHITIDVRAR